LNDLETRASNLAVASGSTIKDFSSEYSQLESRLDDIKKILGVEFDDKALKSLNAQLIQIENHLEFKKAKKLEYAQIEEWVKENEESKTHLANSHSNYTTLKESLDSLRQRTIELIESNKEGATNSIQRAGITSDQASDTLERATETYDSELKPLVEKLQEKLDGYKQNFEQKKTQLGEYYAHLSQNLTSALGGVSGLNLAVCGGVTNENTKCSAECGGSDCGGKCGTKLGKCNGLVDSYWKVVEARDQFLKSYDEQEVAFKRILTKLHRSNTKIGATNAEIERLLQETKKSLETVDNEKLKVKNLIAKVEQFSLSNSEKPKEIKSVSDKYKYL
jgi:ABC-type transporter Mla subunit MlaD